jgi:hypothetical protein
MVCFLLGVLVIKVCLEIYVKKTYVHKEWMNSSLIKWVLEVYLEIPKKFLNISVEESGEGQMFNKP